MKSSRVEIRPRSLDYYWEQARSACCSSSFVLLPLVDTPFVVVDESTIVVVVDIVAFDGADGVVRLARELWTSPLSLLLLCSSGS